MSYKTKEELLEKMVETIRKNPGIRPSVLNRLLNIFIFIMVYNKRYVPCQMLIVDIMMKKINNMDS